MAGGHGSNMNSKHEYSKKSCYCGAGFIVTYEEEWDSDWRGTKSEFSTVNECPNECTINYNKEKSLSEIIENGKCSGKSPYEALKDAGIIKGPGEFFSKQ